MVLKIFSPGLDQYGPGGSARVKTLVIGGPGSGKTRWASFFPKPIYADSEAGLASVADRGTAVAAVKIATSDDMFELIKFLEFDCKQPDRKYETLVVDTIDAFQRKVQDEWLRRNPGADSFRGFDAWGYLDGKMQMLLTRMLNLDMNVIVTVHYEEKTVTEGSGDQAQQRQVVQLQLAGKIKDQLFNDFDLVGWMGVYYQQIEGQRMQKRGLSFTPTYERPFLKDRLNVTPNWMDVTFAPSDYEQLFTAISSKIGDLPASESLGEINVLPETPGVPDGGLLQGGALPPVDPKDVPLEQFDKPTLQAKCRSFDPPIEFKSNTIKSELIALIRQREEDDAKAKDPVQPPAEGQAAPPPADSAPAETTSETKTDDTAATPEQPAAPQTQSPAPEQPAAPAAQAAPEQPAAPAPQVSQSEPAVTQPQTSAEPAQSQAPRQDGPTNADGTVRTEAGNVNPATGEIQSQQAEPSHEEAVAAAQQSLGGEVVSERSTDDAASTATSAPAPAQAPPAPAQGASAGPSGTCEEDGGCDVDLSKENPDLVKLSFIKYRKRLCNNHYQARRNAA